MLGNVTPNLRAVFVQLENMNSFKLVFYYDKLFSETEEELASLVDTDILADFPSPFYSTDFSITALPHPNKISENGYCVYRRFEKDYNPFE